jgi:hypothetical protein
MRPGLAYWLGQRLYLGVTNRVLTTPLVVQRGPAFQMPLHSGFCKLPDDFEPSASDLFNVVNNAYEHDSRKNVSGMGENDEPITFAGYGDPLLRLDIVTEAAKLIKAKRHGVPLRIKTSGLIDDDQVRATAAQDLASAGIKQASVFLPAEDPKKYAAFMGRDSDPVADFSKVTQFICNLAEAGVLVECYCCERPEVDAYRVEALAHALGAVEFRKVSYHP